MCKEKGSWARELTNYILKFKGKLQLDENNSDGLIWSRTVRLMWVPVSIVPVIKVAGTRAWVCSGLFQSLIDHGRWLLWTLSWNFSHLRDTLLFLLWLIFQNGPLFFPWRVHPLLWKLQESLRKRLSNSVVFQLLLHVLTPAEAVFTTLLWVYL